MSIGLISRPWNHQPPAGVGINWENPLTRGLVCAVNPANGPVDIVSGRELTLFGTRPSISSDFDGVSFDNRSAGGGYYFQPRESAATATQSHLIIFGTTLTSQSNWCGVFGNSDASGTNNSFVFQRNSGTPDLIIYTATSATTPYDANVALPLSTYIFQAGTAASDVVERGTRIWRNGELEYTNGSLYPVVYSTSKITLLGERTSSALYSYQGQLFLYIGWTRSLLKEEVKAIQENVWSLFEPEVVYNNSSVPVNPVSSIGGANYGAIAYINSIAKANITNVSSIII